MTGGIAAEYEANISLGNYVFIKFGNVQYKEVYCNNE